MPGTDPMTTVAGYAGAQVASATPPSKDAFKLPDVVTQEEMKTMGRKYGNSW